MTITEPTTDRATSLKAVCGGIVRLPGEPGYDAARTPWNMAVDQRPAAVGIPQTVEQVSGLVRHAARLGLRVSPQATGHAAGILAGHDLADVLLIRTNELTGVYVDPQRRTARVEAGAQWQHVLAAATPHGLTALHGSAPDVGVVGYTLTGGLSFYARKHGLAVNAVTAVELVTATGEIVRADERNHPDLFWALRGGAGANFGVVTALEFRLLPIADVYAGMLIWDVERAPEVVRAWAEWSRTAPEEITTSMRVMRFPPLPDLPPFLSGRSLVIIDGVALLEDDDAAEAIAALRVLQPEMDTFARVPSGMVAVLHMDPPEPVPAVGAGGTLASFDDEAVEAFLAQVGPGVETPVFMAEVRHLGGAVARPAEGAGALPAIDAGYASLFVGLAMGPLAKVAEVACATALGALSPWAAPQAFLNFAERPMDAATGYGEDSWTRLREVRAEVDPGGVFLAHHAIPRA